MSLFALMAIDFKLSFYSLGHGAIASSFSPSISILLESKSFENVTQFYLVQERPIGCD